MVKFIVGVVVVGFIFLLVLVGSWLKGHGWGIMGGGPGTGSPGTLSIKSPDPVPPSGLTVSVEGDKYLVDGNQVSLEEVHSRADAHNKNGQQVVVSKKGNARYLTVKKLEDVLEQRGIRYRSEDSF
jgi:hypothetical protein